MNQSLQDLLLNYMRSLEQETDTQEQRKLRNLFEDNPQLDFAYSLMNNRIEEYNASVDYAQHIKPPSFIIRPLYQISHMTLDRNQAFDTLAHPVTRTFPIIYTMADDLSDNATEYQICFGLLYGLNQGFAASYALDNPLLTSELETLRELNVGIRELYSFYGDSLSEYIIKQTSWFFTGVDAQKFNKLRQLKREYESFQN